MPDKWSDNSHHQYRLRGVYKSKIYTFKLDQPAILMGRDPKGKIVIDHPSVSKKHAIIELVEGKTLIEDLQSDNGTFVNSLQIDPGKKVPLQPGDRIRIGVRRFTLYLEQPPETEATKALSSDAGHPIGPPKSFPPDIDDNKTPDDYRIYPSWYGGSSSGNFFKMLKSH